MSNDSGKPPSQAFRDSSTLKVTNIPAVTDPKTGNPIILWKHIQAAFEKAKAICNGDSLVPFMIDENLEEVTPLRIAYHPGVVLDVIMETISTREAVNLPLTPYSGNQELTDHDNPWNHIMATLAMTDNTIDQSLVMYTRNASGNSPSSSSMV
ncbi:hypothetical protein BGZ65_010435, partial [Modicella reniformis]